MNDARNNDDATARVHVPVMQAEVLEVLAPRAGGVYLDATVGAGGHTNAILTAAPGARVIGLDRDARILDHARATLAAHGAAATLVHSDYSALDDACDQAGIGLVDGALFDLGVSSLQLDDATFGFSFDADGPLDMRMDRDGSTRTAADLVNRGSRADLLHAIGTLGEEPRAGRVVSAILAERERAPIRRTCELAEIVSRVLGSRPLHHHPATRTFLGIRSAVNDELGRLERGLNAAIERLAPGASVAVIAFHGGEDRVVKELLRAGAAASRVAVTTKKPVYPSADEVARNPRARSARMRVARKLPDVSARPSGSN